MVTGILDSSILIDVMRNYNPAITWLVNQGQLGASHFVWLELLEGVENKQKQLQAVKLLRRFTILETNPDDIKWAAEKCSFTNSAIMLMLLIA